MVGRSRSVSTLLALVLVGAALAGCESDPGSVESFVGAIKENDAVVGLSTRDGRARLYVCGGPNTLRTTSRWLSGDVADGSGALSGADGWQATLTRSGATISGTVTTGDGRKLTFDASAAVEATLAGLYSVLDDGCETGVVVRQGSASDTPKVQGVWCAQDGTVAQVTPVQPIVLTQGGLAVRVLVGGGERRLIVMPTIP